MITVKIISVVPRQAICWLCRESIKPDTLHVQANFDEKGHMSTRVSAHMYCSDDFAESFYDEVAKRNAKS